MVSYNLDIWFDEDIQWHYTESTVRFRGELVLQAEVVYLYQDVLEGTKFDYNYYNEFHNHIQLLHI